MILLSKLSVDVSNAATIFCANPEETNLAFFQVNLDEPLAKRFGNWDYSSDYYYPNEMNPETLFAEENDQPLSAAEDVLAVLLQDYYVKRKCGLRRGLCGSTGQSKEKSWTDKE